MIIKVLATVLLVILEYNILQLYIFKLTYTPYCNNLFIKAGCRIWGRVKRVKLKRGRV